MSYSSGEELESKVGSRYSLVIAVAKRAKQLKAGQPRMVDSKSKNLITVALEEISAGKLKLVQPTEEQILAVGNHSVAAETHEQKDTSELLKVPDTLESLDESEDAVEESVSAELSLAEDDSAQPVSSDDEEISPDAVVTDTSSEE